MKKSFRNINEENKKIASSLLASSSNLKQQNFSRSFSEHRKIQQRITKYEHNSEGVIQLKQMKSVKRFKTLQGQNPEEKN